MGSFGRVSNPLQTQRRAIVKTGMYRAVMVAVSIVVAYVVVGNVTDALSIGLATNLVKTLTYFGYERIWDRIAWGV